MVYWLQSLSENGFDVFTLVYIATLVIINHYMLRWFINIKIEKLENKLLRSARFFNKDSSTNTEDVEVVYEYLDNPKNKINNYPIGTGFAQKDLKNKEEDA
jgi:hypothetical protein